jgi:tetratricopeptide (TPR) repeat protein
VKSRLRQALVGAAVAAATAAAPAQVRPPADPVVLAAQGEAALKERRYSDALAAFTAAAARRPDDASLPYGAALAASMMGSDAEAERFLSRALALQPAMLDASLLLGDLQYRSGRLRDAIATYQSALSRNPDDRALPRRIAQWQAEERLQSRFTQERGRHFRVLFEGPEDQALAFRVVEMLERQYVRIGGLLRFYPDRSIEVVLYTLQQFRDVTRSPAWAGAVYDGRIRIPARGAGHQMEYLERVVAHEFVHALVARLGGPEVPAWLHEGLAMVLEPGESVGEATAVLAHGRLPLKLDDLHEGFGGLDLAAARVAYATSTVAAQRMLDLRGPDGVVLLLKDLAAGTPFGAAFRQRIGMPYAEFQDLIR